MDPYGSSFRLKLDFDDKGKEVLTDWDFKTGRTIHVAMHDYEIDSLCYFIRLSYNYMKIMEQCYLFESEWLGAAKSIVALWKVEQDHAGQSSYSYPIYKRGGKGDPICNTGLTWGGSRPSDDPCVYNFSIPSNMFAVVVLRHLQEILSACYPAESTFLQEVKALEKEIDDAIHAHGIVTDSDYGDIYAYEIDGCGRTLLMDDANVPSLMSMDYLGYTSQHDPKGVIKANTYKFILSTKNPYFYSGSTIEGIGSPHTNPRMVWPMSLIIQALSKKEKGEVNHIIDMLERSDGGTGFMHESVDVTNPNRYTRSWFAWANSLFSELIITHLNDIVSKDT